MARRVRNDSRRSNPAICTMSRRADRAASLPDPTMPPRSNSPNLDAASHVRDLAIRTSPAGNIASILGQPTCIYTLHPGAGGPLFLSQPASLARARASPNDRHPPRPLRTARRRHRCALPRLTAKPSTWRTCAGKLCCSTFGRRGAAPAGPKCPSLRRYTAGFATKVFRWWVSASTQPAWLGRCVRWSTSSS